LIMTSRALCSGARMLATNSGFSASPSASKLSHQSRRLAVGLVAADQIALADHANG
jgi:hypothetical protein